MTFEEPVVEVVDVDLHDIVVTSTASGEDCVGPEAMMNNCSKYSTFMNNWLEIFFTNSSKGGYYEKRVRRRSDG